MEFLGGARGRVALAACLALAAQAAFAANPQPYEIDWAPSGNDAVDSTMKATSQLETLRKTAPVDPFGLIARARGDVSRLQTVLQSFGYYGGAITITINGKGLDSVGLGNDLSALPKGSDAHVRIDPRLGPLFHVGHVGIKGALPPGMRKHLPLSSGAPAVASDVLAAGATLQTALADAGYAFAKVDKPVAYERPAQHVLDVTFPVTTGPRVRIGAIRVEGLKHVHESLVQRRLLVRSGEQYDAAAVEKAREDLLNTGVFSTVSVRLGKATADGRVPLTIIVQEAKRYTVGVSAAYSSDLGGSGGINWSDRNVFGNAQQLAFSATAINLGGTASTGLGYDTRLAYTIPDFHRRDQTLSLSVEALRQELQAYAENGQIVSAILSRKLSSVWSATAGVSYEHEVVGQPGATCPPPPGVQPKEKSGIAVCPFSEIRTYELLLLPITARYDSTNLASPLDDPTHGFRISLNLTPTFSYGQSGAVFIVSQASVSHYVDVHQLFARDPPGRTVLAARVMAGLAEGAIWYNLPPAERFYAGGSGTVRGYRYQSVGPQFQTNGAPSGIPQGGTTIQVADLELRQRVGTNFGFVVFADGGGVSQSSRPFSGIFRVGVGTGVRYYTSIGPIRFDVAFPVHRRASDDSFEIYIGLGQAF
ncbi:MAG TPA: BamA/TamA family outer membrane protein [Steroidobacteraceae bacterium]|nr:BamA/TamA family outer membrane protein [Steroidobacteraceae bacterium]